jgi:hypothetical protein
VLIPVRLPVIIEVPTRILADAELERRPVPLWTMRTRSSIRFMAMVGAIAAIPSFTLPARYALAHADPVGRLRGAVNPDPARVVLHLHPFQHDFGSARAHRSDHYSSIGSGMATIGDGTVRHIKLAGHTRRWSEIDPYGRPATETQILQFSMCRARPLTKLSPIRPVPTPSIDRFRRVTTTPSAFTFTPLMFAAAIPANVSPQSMVIDLVMVTTPKPLASRQLTIPPAAVFAMAPPNVLQGAVRPQLLASSPAPARAGYCFTSAPD